MGTRNFEVDSGAYFMNLLWNYYASPNLFNTREFCEHAVKLAVKRSQTSSKNDRSDHDS